MIPPVAIIVSAPQIMKTIINTFLVTKTCSDYMDIVKLEY